MAKTTLVLTKHFLGWVKYWVNDIYLSITDSSFVPLMYWWLDGNYYTKNGELLREKGGTSFIPWKTWKCHLITGSSLAVEAAHSVFGRSSPFLTNSSQCSHLELACSSLCTAALETFEGVCVPFRDERHKLRTVSVRKLKDFPLDLYLFPALRWLSQVSIYFDHRRWHSGFRSSSERRRSPVSSSGCEGPSVPSEVLAPSSGTFPAKEMLRESF